MDLPAQVARAFGLPVPAIRGALRGCHDIARARQIVMYLARVALGLTYTGAGRLVGRDRTTAAYACRVIEDLRDDPVFDARLSALEAGLRRAGAGDPR